MARHSGASLDRSEPTGRPREPQPTRTRTIAELDEEVGHQRGATRLLVEDVSTLSARSADLHRATTADRITELARERAKFVPRTLLEALDALGFAWRDVARCLHVSVPAVRKWRHGESISGEHRQQLARLVAVCDLLREVHMVEDVAGWFETPLLTRIPVTPLDLYISGLEHLVIEHAAQHTSVEEVLNQYDPEWRQRCRSDFERFTAADGEISLGLRSSGHHAEG